MLEHLKLNYHCEFCYSIKNKLYIGISTSYIHKWVTRAEKFYRQTEYR